MDPEYYHAILSKFRQGVGYLLLIAGPTAPIVFRFDPIFGMWIGWFAVMSLSLIHGVIPFALRFPRYLSGTLLAFLLAASLTAMYVETATGWLLCLPPQNEGAVLRPSALPSPVNPCLTGRTPFPTDQAFVFFGTNAGPIPPNRETNIIGVDNGPALVQAGIASDGGLSITAEVYDTEGVLLAEIKDNHPSAVGNVCIRRPDLSTFLVEDYHRTELLSVRYLNPRAIEVRGLFKYPGALSLRVGIHEVAPLGSVHMSTAGNCFRYMGGTLLGLSIR